MRSSVQGGYTKSRMKQFTQLKLKMKRHGEESTSYRVPIRLPPKWVDKLEETRDMISKVATICNEVERLRQHNPSGPMQTINEQQRQNKLDMGVQMMRDIEENLLLMDDQDGCENDEEYKMKQNAKMCLAISLKEVTPQMRIYQRDMMQQLQIERPPPKFQQHPIHIQNQTDYQMQQIMIENVDDTYLEQIALDRNDRIKGLGEKIKNMTELFREMNRLVIEQGTLLDRIDFNIDQAYHRIKNAKGQLVQANSRQETSLRAQKCICILVGLNILFVGVLIAKYTLFN